MTYARSSDIRIEPFTDPSAGSIVPKVLVALCVNSEWKGRRAMPIPTAAEIRIRALAVIVQACFYNMRKVDSWRVSVGLIAMGQAIEGLEDILRIGAQRGSVVAGHRKYSLGERKTRGGPSF
jgi:hypothetical protein